MSNKFRLLSFMAFFAVALLIAPITRAVPPRPTDVADMIGIYNWGVDYSSYDSSTDRLNWAAEKIAEMGTRTIRVAISARDPYMVNPSIKKDDDPNWLVKVASSSAYETLFGSDSFRTYLLTTYTPADGPADQSLPTWVNGFDPSSSAYDVERTQIENLCQYLFNTYPSKTFIILNWEGDNAVQGALGVNNDPAVWDNYVNWQQSRADGVAMAKAAGVNNVFFGIEFNFVVAPGGEPCGGTPFGGPGNQPSLANRCVIDYVAPRVHDVDYFSYSSWQTIGLKVGQPQVNLQQAINYVLGGSLNLVKAGQGKFQGQSNVEPASFLLGEFGFARTDYGECNAASYTKELVNAVIGPGSFGASYAIFWQVIDNAPPPQNSWGLFRGSDGEITTLGTTLEALIKGQNPVIPGNCPEINLGGILNDDTGPDHGTQNLHPNTTMKITGTNFSLTGNVVSVIQDDKIYHIQDGSTNWSESTTQITAKMPNISGPALVYVTNGSAMDSKAQIVTITGTVESDFTLSFDQAMVTVARGNNVKPKITINGSGGFTGNVTITPPASPKGLKVKPANPVTTTSSATFKVKVKGSASPGTYDLVFTGTDSSGKTRTATLTVVVQ